MQTPLTALEFFFFFFRRPARQYIGSEIYNKAWKPDRCSITGKTPSYFFNRSKMPGDLKEKVIEPLLQAML